MKSTTSDQCKNCTLVIDGTIFRRQTLSYSNQIDFLEFTHNFEKRINGTLRTKLYLSSTPLIPDRIAPEICRELSASPPEGPGFVIINKTEIEQDVRLSGIIIDCVHGLNGHLAHDKLYIITNNEKIASAVQIVEMKQKGIVTIISTSKEFIPTTLHNYIMTEEDSNNVVYLEMLLNKSKMKRKMQDNDNEDIGQKRMKVYGTDGDEYFVDIDTQEDEMGSSDSTSDNHKTEVDSTHGAMSGKKSESDERRKSTSAALTATISTATGAAAALLSKYAAHASTSSSGNGVKSEVPTLELVQRQYVIGQIKHQRSELRNGLQSYDSTNISEADMTMLHETKLIVSGAMYAAYNGEFSFKGIMNNAGFFEKAPSLKYKPPTQKVRTVNTRFLIYKCALNDGTYCWFMSLVRGDTILPGNKSDENHYYNRCLDSKYLPSGEWYSMQKTYARDTAITVSIARLQVLSSSNPSRAPPQFVTNSIDVAYKQQAIQKQLQQSIYDQIDNDVSTVASMNNTKKEVIAFIRFLNKERTKEHYQNCDTVSFNNAHLKHLKDTVLFVARCDVFPEANGEFVFDGVMNYSGVYKRYATLNNQPGQFYIFHYAMYDGVNSVWILSFKYGHKPTFNGGPCNYNCYYRPVIENEEFPMSSTHPWFCVGNRDIAGRSMIVTVKNEKLMTTTTSAVAPVQTATTTPKTITTVTKVAASNLAKTPQNENSISASQSSPAAAASTTAAVSSQYVIITNSIESDCMPSEAAVDAVEEGEVVNDDSLIEAVVPATFEPVEIVSQEQQQPCDVVKPCESTSTAELVSNDNHDHDDVQHHLVSMIQSLFSHVSSEKITMDMERVQSFITTEDFSISDTMIEQSTQLFGVFLSDMIVANADNTDCNKCAENTTNQMKDKPQESDDYDVQCVKMLCIVLPSLYYEQVESHLLSLLMQVEDICEGLSGLIVCYCELLYEYHNANADK